MGTYRREREVLAELPDVVQRRCIDCGEWWPDDSEFFPDHANGGHPKPRCWACDLDLIASRRGRLGLRLRLPQSDRVSTRPLNERDAAILAALPANGWRQTVTAAQLHVSTGVVSWAVRRARAHGEHVGDSQARWGRRSTPDTMAEETPAL